MSERPECHQDGTTYNAVYGRLLSGSARADDHHRLHDPRAGSVRPSHRRPRPHRHVRRRDSRASRHLRLPAMTRHANRPRHSWQSGSATRCRCRSVRRGIDGTWPWVPGSRGLRNRLEARADHWFTHRALDPESSLAVLRKASPFPGETRAPASSMNDPTVGRRFHS